MGVSSSSQKLKCLKNQLKEWNKTTFGIVSQIKDDLSSTSGIGYQRIQGRKKLMLGVRGVLKKSSLKLQFVRKLNGGKKLDLNVCKKEIIILSSFIILPTLTVYSIGFQF